MVFESCKNTSASAAILHLASCVCSTLKKAILLHHGLSLFTSSWVIIIMEICTAPILCLRMLSKGCTNMAATQEVQIPSKKYFCCVHFGNTTIRNLQIEILHTYLLFQANLHFCFGVSFKQTVCCLWIRQERVEVSCIKIHYPHAVVHEKHFPFCSAILPSGAKIFFLTRL